MRLNDLACRNAKPRDKTYKLFDGEGLYLEVLLNGNRYWRLKYRVFGKEKRLSLGQYPNTSLAEARTEKDKHKKSLQNFIDPSEQRQEQKRLAQLKASETFEAITQEWHTYNYKNWSKGHADNILHRLRNDVFPHIGSTPISKLTPPAIYNCLQKIEGRGANELARRSLQMCGQIFRYAVVKGYVERDITVDMKRTLKKFSHGHFASIEIDELPALIKSINRNEARLFRQTILAMQLMLLTFVRTSELIEAEWPEINFDKAEWNIPAARMKMRLPHVVPLSQQSIRMLRELKEINGNRKYVFPSIPKPQQPMSNGTILMALKRMGYNGKMTGHGFRSLAMSTIKEKLGFQHEIVDRQLAHAPRSKIDQAYDRAKFLPQRKIMMQAWADYIEGLC